MDKISVVLALCFEALKGLTQVICSDDNTTLETLMNLNATRQGAMPFSLHPVPEQKNTISDFNGLIEYRQLAGLTVQDKEIKAIIFRSNIRESLFRHIQFSNFTLNRCYLENIVFENCDMRNVCFSHSVITKPIILRRCQVAGMRLMSMHRRMFVFEECTGVGQMLIA